MRSIQELHANGIVALRATGYEESAVAIPSGIEAGRPCKVLLDIARIVLPGDALENHTQQIVTCVAIAPAGARFEVEGLIAYQFQDVLLREIDDHRLVKWVSYFIQALNPGGVVQKLKNGDAFFLLRIPGNVFGYVVIEPDHASLDLLKNCRGGKLLRERTDLIDGVQAGRNPVLEISVPRSTGNQGIVSLENHHRGAGKRQM
jgi:hypothetical protein